MTSLPVHGKRHSRLGLFTCDVTSGGKRYGLLPVILSHDQWRVAVTVILNTYHKVLSTVKSDLLAFEQQRKEFTSTSELKQIELFEQILVDKLHDFCQILPRPDP